MIYISLNRAVRRKSRYLSLAYWPAIWTISNIYVNGQAKGALSMLQFATLKKEPAVREHTASNSLSLHDGARFNEILKSKEMWADATCVHMSDAKGGACLHMNLIRNNVWQPDVNAFLKMQHE
jgi:hypothetical protein